MKLLFLMRHTGYVRNFESTPRVAARCSCIRVATPLEGRDERGVCGVKRERQERG